MVTPLLKFAWGRVVQLFPALFFAYPQSIFVQISCSIFTQKNSNPQLQSIGELF